MYISSREHEADECICYLVVTLKWKARSAQAVDASRIIFSIAAESIICAFFSRSRRRDVRKGEHDMLHIT